MTNPFLIGSKIYLRAVEPGDETIFCLSENHPEPRDQLFYALPTSMEVQRLKAERETSDPNTIIFTVCTIKPDAPVGKTAFYRIDWVGRTAVFYIAIAESKNWSAGYGQETTNMMVEYALNTLNLHRIQLHVHAGNQRAVNVYKKAGFQLEGTLRQAMFHKGRYCDFYVMGILASDREVKIAK